jgi:Na+/H+ antiporter NhaD/arsenite permease-like protein
MTTVDAAHGIDASALGPIWGVPFGGLLLSMAVLPLLRPALWHGHMGKLTLGWALLTLLPLAATQGAGAATVAVLHTTLLDYLPFIILLTALYTVAGGIRIAGSVGGRPLANTAVLGVGTVLAGWIGTTGAAMLLVRALIDANHWRRHQAHVLVFFIFLVANVGGALSPLGDPPLFLGFLRGVDFFWPTRHLMAPTLVVAGVLLLGFYLLDSALFRREKGVPPRNGDRFGIQGAHNLPLLLAIIMLVMMSGMLDLGELASIAGVSIKLDDALRDVGLIGVAWLSLRVGSQEVRRRNHYSWGPMIEVAVLFAGIFVTIIPVLAMLRLGERGPLGELWTLLHDNGQPVEAMYFLLTGLLSSVLDNAPTYLVFFNAAGGDPHGLMGPLAGTLLAISAGAVYMGANTYIGNAPNLMVKAIAEARGVRMPSFFGYIGWSAICLTPPFALVGWAFF